MKWGQVYTIQTIMSVSYQSVCQYSDYNSVNSLSVHPGYLKNEWAKPTASSVLQNWLVRRWGWGEGYSAGWNPTCWTFKIKASTATWNASSFQLCYHRHDGGIDLPISHKCTSKNVKQFEMKPNLNLNYTWSESLLAWLKTFTVSEAVLFQAAWKNQKWRKKMARIKTQLGTNLSSFQTIQSE